MSTEDGCTIYRHGITRPPLISTTENIAQAEITAHFIAPAQVYVSQHVNGMNSETLMTNVNGAMTGVPLVAKAQMVYAIFQRRVTAVKI